MAPHEETRLETTGGTVIAYLAPNAETTPTLNNDLLAEPRARGRPAIVRDNQQITFEITAQGTFIDSDELPDAHRTDLENLFGYAPVTAMDQINRVVHFAHDTNEGGPMHFYWRGNSFNAPSESDVDYQNGVYPPVAIDQFRPPTAGGFSRGEYMLKLAVGVPRGD